MSLDYLLEHTGYQLPYETLREEYPADVAGPLFHFRRLELLEEMGRLPELDQGFAFVHAFPMAPDERPGDLPKRGDLAPVLWHGIHSFETNLDGLVLPGEAAWETFTTVSRNGWVETVTQNVHRAVNAEERRVFFYDAIGVALSAYQVAQQQVGEMPLHLVLSLHHVRGRQVFTQGGIMGMGVPKIDRDPLFIQHSVTQPDLRADEALRPLVERLWQASGLTGVRNYNEEGEWEHWADNFPT